MVETGSTGRPFPGWEDITEDLTPAEDDDLDLGDSDKRWAYLYAVIAVLTSMTLGGIYLGATTEGFFFINATTQINGSLAVLGDNITISGNEVATLDDLVAGNVTVSSLIKVKNTAGATASKGAAMTFSGYNAAIDRYDIIFANNTARHGHAHCVMTSTVANNGQGQCLVFGALETFDTSAWSEGDDLYLNETPGTLTSTKPTSAACIQKLAVVLRDHASQGSIYVHGAGRCNDVPYNFSISGNITASYFFGNGSQLTDIIVTETDPKAYNGTLAYLSDILGWGYYNSTDFSISDYFTKTNILDFGYYNSTDFDIADYSTTSTITGWGYWNDTYATFNKTYADTLYSTIAEPLWSANFTAYNSSWSSITNTSYYLATNPFGFYNSTDFDIADYLLDTTDTFTGNLTFADANNCIIFNSGGKICSGV